MNANPIAARAFARMTAEKAAEFKTVPELWKRLSDLRSVQYDHSGKLQDFVVRVADDADLKWHLEATVKPDRPLLFRERAFEQFCSTIEFPAKTLVSCPGMLARQNVAFFAMASGSKGSLLREENGEIRAWLSDQYQKVDHIEIVNRLMESGVRWEVNFAALTPKRMFILGVDPEAKWDGPDGSKLSHCTLVGNSETGEGSFFAQDLWFDHICANRNIWGSQVRGGSFHRIHKGDVRDGLREMFKWIAKADSTAIAASKEMFTKAAKEFVPETDEKIMEYMKNRGIAAWIGKEALSSAHDRWPGKRLSRFNLMSGLTKVAQGLDQDSRYELELSAAKILA